MQMIEVMKRLAELDNANGGLKESTQLVKDPAIAMISEGQDLAECGPMGMPSMSGGMGSHPASFSINASAASGDEVASMLTQIMTLAGVKSHGDMGDMGEKDPLNAEPPMSAGDDMKAAISAIDQAEQETSMMGDTTPEMEDDSEPDFQMATAGPAGGDVGAMADTVQDMADQLAGTDKEELGLESLRQFDNSPQEQTRKTDPLNDFASILNKVREFDYTPPSSGSNPMKAESVQAPAQESTGLLDLTNNLFKEYQAYKAQ